MTTPLVYRYIDPMKKKQSHSEHHISYPTPHSYSDYYEIRIKGFIDPGWEWLEDMAVSYVGPDVTLISGRILDQSALHGFLARIRDLNLTLLSVEQIDSNDL